MMHHQQQMMHGAQVPHQQPTAITGQPQHPPGYLQNQHGQMPQQQQQPQQAVPAPGTLHTQAPVVQQGATAQPQQQPQYPLQTQVPPNQHVPMTHPQPQHIAPGKPLVIQVISRTLL